ncbi:MAG: YibE/F family protein [bacterium]|nr:YibE/F family protein [bacterium]
MKKIWQLILAIMILLEFLSPIKIGAYESGAFEAKVTQIVEEKNVTPANSDQSQTIQTLELEALDGEKKGQKIVIEGNEFATASQQKYEIGEEVVIDGSGENLYIADYVRRAPIICLTIIFVVLAVWVGRWQGATSLLGLGVSFAVIFWFTLPKIAGGSNPVTIVVLSCLVMIPILFILSHGLNRKMVVAMIATLLTLIITGLLIVFFVDWANLTGLASEEAGFLQAMNPDTINFKNLLIAGMLIATLGVLDDITISQAAVVEELKKANPDLKFWPLFRRAMSVGRDHIASMINTLILAYAGASFPLLLLFLQSGQSIGLTLNFEIIADEIIRTLAGSIGLILAVPLTTILAAWVENWRSVD